GGVCALDEAAERTLVDAAVELARSEGAALDLRHVGERDVGLPVSLEKVTMLLDLGADEEETWRRLPSERRNRIRKGQRAGLATAVGSAELLTDFYRVFAVNMRDLGSPVHAMRFFQEVLAGLPGRSHVIVVRNGRQSVAGAVMLANRDTLSVPWVSSLHSARPLCAGQVLYWEAMRFAVSRGHRVLDFGRSSKV